MRVGLALGWGSIRNGTELALGTGAATANWPELVDRTCPRSGRLTRARASRPNRRRKCGTLSWVNRTSPRRGGTVEAPSMRMLNDMELVHSSRKHSNLRSHNCCCRCVRRSLPICFYLDQGGYTHHPSQAHVVCSSLYLMNPPFLSSLGRAKKSLKLAFCRRDILFALWRLLHSSLFVGWR